MWPAPKAGGGRVSRTMAPPSILSLNSAGFSAGGLGPTPTKVAPSTLSLSIVRK